MARTAAALIIGNEILTGKIREANLEVLARELRGLGIVLRRAVFCLDDVETIAEELTALRGSHDMVFTSGGVGPTLDDVTLLGVARSFGRPLERSPLIQGLIEGYFGERTTADHLSMADVPRGAELLQSAEVPWPVIAVDNVFVLPGVPKIFEKKLRVLRERIGADRPFVTRALLTTCDEGTIAAHLERVAEAFPAVDLGSYPRTGEAKYRVKLTFDGLDAAEVEAARDACAEAIGADHIVAPE